ncbi:MAG: acylphosphatase, partial [Desulfobacteraceae bacterium]|nr:acylphosphatase [Desulfobacteraceae bacterium]
MIKRTKGTIEGIVQGVGFRPFIYQLAFRYDLAGYVVNTAEGVEIEIEGPETEIRRFIDAVEAERPSLAYIASTDWTEIPSINEDSFAIKKSRVGKERSALISPDVGICPECLSEMRNPRDRRFGYPFINCT